MYDGKMNSTHEENQKPEQELDQKHEAYVRAKALQYAAENKDSGSQHTMPLVVHVNGQPVYTRDNY